MPWVLQYAYIRMQICVERSARKKPKPSFVMSPDSVISLL